MPRKMLVNMRDPDECRVAVVQDRELQELFIEHASAEHYVGNIYKGRVENVEPSIQAAFVDLGLERNGFLHVSDVNPDYLKHERGPKKGQGHQFPKLQNVLRRGQEVVVQVTKSGIGTKGPALTTYLSLAGRFLVLMPNIKRHGVSRKIEDDEQRQRLKETLSQIKAPQDMGVIVRTAGEGRTKRELQRDLAYLQRLYTAINKRIKSTKAPALIYQESDLVTRVIRDFFTPDTDEVVVDNEFVRKKAEDFLQGIMPRYTNRVKLYEGDMPLFHAYGIEKQIESIYQRRVELDGGGYIVIDQAEALVAIDVNSGSFRERRDPEENAYQLDMLAAREVARQLRLRDLGGVIVIDFIDMLDQKHRRDVEKALSDELKQDKARYKVLRMSDFGIVEMTRQRMRPSVRRAMFAECPHCQGTGMIRTSESMAIGVLRLLPIALAHDDAVQVEVTVSRDVALHLNNAKRRDIVGLEDRFKKTVSVLADNAAGVDYARFVCYDKSGGTTECDPVAEAARAKEPVFGKAREDERAQPRPERQFVQARESQQSQPPQPQQAITQEMFASRPEEAEFLREPEGAQPEATQAQPPQPQQPQQGQEQQQGKRPRRRSRSRGGRHHRRGKRPQGEPVEAGEHGTAPAGVAPAAAQQPASPPVHEEPAPEQRGKTAARGPAEQPDEPPQETGPEISRDLVD